MLLLFLLLFLPSLLVDRHQIYHIIYMSHILIKKLLKNVFYQMTK